MSNLSFSGECPYCNHIFTVRADSDDVEQKTAKQICPDCNKMCLIKADSDDYILAAEQSIPASKTKQQSSHYEEPPKEQASHSTPDDISDSDESFSFFEILSFISIVLVGIFLISTFSAFFSDTPSLELIYNKVFNAFSGGIGSIIFAVILGGVIGTVATVLIAQITDSEHSNASNLCGALVVCLYFFTPESNPSTVIEPAVNQEQAVVPHPPTDTRCVGDCENSQGTYTWDDGSTHSGEWLKGEKHGYGTSIWASGNSYEGEWEKGEKNGYGTQIWANRNVYKGEWKGDVYHGQGTLTWPDGENYKGSWLDDNKHGYGVYSWPSGSRYAGQWRDGEKHGSGIYSWEDGTKESGEWRNGERID